MYFIYILKKLILKVCKPYVLKIHSVLQEVGVGERKMCIVIHFIVSLFLPCSVLLVQSGKGGGVVLCS